MVMLLVSDWEARLASYVDSMRGVPFAWGVNDCATFATGCAEAMLGSEIAGKPAFDYTDRRGAVDFSSSHSFAQSLKGLTGAVEIPCRIMSVGDFIIYGEMQHERIHVILGRAGVSMAEGRGLVRFPVSMLPHTGMALRLRACQ